MGSPMGQCGRRAAALPPGRPGSRPRGWRGAGAHGAQLAAKLHGRAPPAHDLLGPGPPGRLSALSVSHYVSRSYRVFVWARRALSCSVRFPARAAPPEVLGRLPGPAQRRVKVAGPPMDTAHHAPQAPHQSAHAHGDMPAHPWIHAHRAHLRMNVPLYRWGRVGCPCIFHAHLCTLVKMPGGAAGCGRRRTSVRTCRRPSPTSQARGRTASPARGAVVGTAAATHRGRSCEVAGGGRMGRCSGGLQSRR
jgi:hypothetical protein